MFFMFCTSTLANGAENKDENHLKSSSFATTLVKYIQPISILEIRNKSEHYLTDIATTIYTHNHSFLRIGSADRSSLNCMIENIYLEARGEDLKGKILVGSVVINRSKDKHYPSTICGVVYQPHQFSWTGNRKVINHFHKISTVDKRVIDEEYRESVWAGFYTVLFHGSLDSKVVAYYAPKGVKKAPAWSKSRSFKCWGKHGGHVLYIAMDATLTKTQGSARNRS